MTVIRIRNASSAAEPPAPPQKDDQSFYLFEMIHDGGSWRAYADTPDELLDAIIPEYTGLTSPRERAAARIRLALRLQVQLQALLDTAPELAQCTDEQRAVLLSSRENPPTVQVWDAPVPLVLVSTFYRPEGRLPRPTGPTEALIWIDPGDAWSLLLSLHNAGVVALNTTEGVLPPLVPEGGN
ncbi:hypothetical protein [Streptacidiphilus jiangxiensis]|uniref:Uncharacterized protein n=1 Tax=Streptacidiphilus jiangxiensis TaxID=235985 RepID=A0A1H8ARK2_STRJI|nr:hypothetical protein [Streptacidiphilus jiangxiensis]SEM72448.1 hypothetical protein SAMN05414137_14812 [Streptacidiphilus jiangxiensis]